MDYLFYMLPSLSSCLANEFRYTQELFRELCRIPQVSSIHHTFGEALKQTKDE